MATTTYRVERSGQQWCAVADGERRTFATRDEAIRWCTERAQHAGTDAAPEEGAYGEADVEIDDG